MVNQILHMLYFIRMLTKIFPFGFAFITIDLKIYQFRVEEMKKKTQKHLNDFVF